MPALALVLLLETQLAFQVGAPAPRITLPSGQDGKPLSLEAFRGRKVMLHVWASW